MRRTSNLRAAAGGMLRCLAAIAALWSVVPFRATADDAKPVQVVTTTGMIADAAARVGGDRVQVVSLMGAGTDPHLYRATQGDLGRLQKADIILFNGLHLEGKMGEVFEALGKRKPVVAVTDGIPRSELRAPPEFEGNYDPHVWFDVKLWIRVVDEIAKRLTEKLPADAAGFEARRAAYSAELTDLDGWVRAELETVPKDRRVLVTAHDAFGYFGRAYAVEVVGLQGISTAAEFGLHDLTRTVDLVVSRKIPSVFVESSVPRKFVEALQEGAKAQGHTITIGGELFSDSMGEPGTEAATYIGMVRHNVSTIVKALR